MGFLKKLFGGRDGQSPSPTPSDPDGIYFYARCNNCGTIVRVRAHKQHDLNNSEGGGYEWHKTIVDSKCFRRMTAVVHLDRTYTITASDLTGGVFVTAAEYNNQSATD